MAFPFFAVAGAGAFGTLGFLGAQSKNKAIERNAINQQNALNENVKRLRLNFFDTSRIAAENLQRRTGQIEGTAFQGFASGHSLNRVIAAEVHDARRDQEARATALRYNVENIETQKQNIADQASAQTSSPIMAAIQGGIQGFSLGSSIDGGLASLGQASQQADVLSGIETALEADPSNFEALAQLRAFTSGVPTELIGAGGAIGQAVIQPFMTQMRTEAFQTGALNNALSFQRAQSQAALNSLFSSQQRFDLFSGSPFGGATFDPTANPLLQFTR